MKTDHLTTKNMVESHTYKPAYRKTYDLALTVIEPKELFTDRYSTCLWKFISKNRRSEGAQHEPPNRVRLKKKALSDFWDNIRLQFNFPPPKNRHRKKTILSLT